MFELLVAGALGVAGHFKSKDFVQKRLRYTHLIEKPGLGLAAGVTTAVVAAPLVWVLPFVGGATALVVGAGVGTGVALGAARARRGGYDDDLEG
jgi:hypothetical protein